MTSEFSRFSEESMFNIKMDNFTSSQDSDIKNTQELEFDNFGQKSKSLFSEKDSGERPSYNSNAPEATCLYVT